MASSEIAINVRQEVEVLPDKWSEEIASMRSDAICAAFRHEWMFASFHYWRAVLMLAKIIEDGAWMGQSDDGGDARSINEWLLKLGLPGLVNAPTISRILGVSRWFAKLDSCERSRWVTHSIWDVVEVLPVAKKISNERAYEIVSMPITARQKRDEVRREVAAEQHHDVSGYRNFKVLTTKDDYVEIAKAMNAAKHFLHVRDPHEGAALHAMAVDFLSGFVAPCARIEPMFDMMPNQFRRALNNEIMEDILAGDLVCIECGSWVVQRHHCPPRSMNRRRADGELWNPDDPEWPCVYLCPECHQMVHANFEGTWPRWAGKWREQDARFARRLDAFTTNSVYVENATERTVSDEQQHRESI